MSKGFDVKALAAAMQMAGQFAKTDEGKKLIEQIKGKNADEVLSGIKAGEIKVNGLDPNHAADMLEKNPDLIKKVQSAMGANK